MKQASDVELLDLMKKYKDQILNAFSQSAKESEYTETNEVSEVDILDQILCQASEENFIGDVIDSIEDSIGMDSLGYECPEEEEE